MNLSTATDLQQIENFVMPLWEISPFRLTRLRFSMYSPIHHVRPSWGEHE